jgi:antitoxin VapB
MTRTAKLFASGGSQAVRLPADFRFAGTEVFVYRDGERVVLAPKPESWDDFLEKGPRATDDFLTGVEDLPVQERKVF